MKRNFIFKFIFVLLCVSLSVSNSFAECDEKMIVASKKIIQQVTNNKATSRQTSDQVPDAVFYTFDTGWHSLNRDQQYKIVNTIGMAEQCLNRKANVRFFAAGKEVAKSNMIGTEIY